MISKKLVLSSFVLLSLVLTGCGKNNKSSEEPLPEEFEIAITPNQECVGLQVEEERQLVIIEEFKTPFKLKYTSLDPEIATIDENGLIKGLKQGSTRIVVQDLNRKSAGVYVDVIVTETLKSREMRRLFNDLKVIGMKEKVDNFVKEEKYEKIVYKNGVQHTYEMMDQNQAFSKEHAYFGIFEKDYDTKIEDGSKEFVSSDWIFYTNEYYDSYTFHNSGAAKKYYVAPTAAYIGQPRTAPLEAILDNLFVSGSEIFTKGFDDASLSDVCENMTGSYTNVKNQRAGKLEDGTVVCALSITFDDEKADQDDESRYGIPYGTPTPTVQDMYYVIKDNKVTNSYFEITETYTIGEDEYLEKYRIGNHFVPFSEGNPELVYPDKEDYTLVDYLFDI